MKPSGKPADRRYRLWIGQTGRWRPRCWRDVPPRLVALEPADCRVYSARHALAFLEGFNSQMLTGQGEHWAVAVAQEALDDQAFAPRRFLSGRQLRRDGPHRHMRGRHSPAVPATNLASPPQTSKNSSTLRFVRAMHTGR